MTAEIIRCRTFTGEPMWQVTEGDDVITCWLDKDGFHSQRESARRNKNGVATTTITHAVQDIPWHQLIDKAEGQLTLL